MTVFTRTLILRVRVIIILAVTVPVEDVALWIVLPLIERSGIAQQLANDVVVGFLQDALAFQDILARLQHTLERFPVEILELGAGRDIRRCRNLCRRWSCATHESPSH